MTGFIRRPHLFAAHVNISWCRELFDSEPKPRWLAQFSSLRHKTSPALSSSLLFYNLNFCVSLLFGCVSPSLRRPKPRQVTRSSGLETLIRKLLSFVLNISPFFLYFLIAWREKWPFCVKYFDRKTSGGENIPAPHRCYTWVATRSCKRCIMLWMFGVIQMGQKQEYFRFSLKVDIDLGPPPGTLVLLLRDSFSVPVCTFNCQFDIVCVCVCVHKY